MNQKEFVEDVKSQLEAICEQNRQRKKIEKLITIVFLLQLAGFIGCVLLFIAILYFPRK